MFDDYDENGKDTERTKFYKSAQAHTQSIDKARSRGLDSNLENVVGLCARCDHYQFVENDMHQVIHSVCWVFDRTLGRNKVRNCSQFAPKNQLNLNAMWQLATLIDPGNIRQKAGFLSRDDETTNDIEE